DPEDVLATEIAQAPLVGRDEILERLIKTATAAIRPSITTVIAEPGLGKSRLFAALEDRLRQETDVQQIAFCVHESLDGDPAASLRELLSVILAPDGKALAAEELQSKVNSLAIEEQGWRAVSAILGWNPSDPRLDALRATPSALASLAAGTLGDRLRRLSRDRPLVLLMDDAQFADPVTLDAVEYALLAEASAII